MSTANGFSFGSRGFVPFSVGTERGSVMKRILFATILSLSLMVCLIPLVWAGGLDDAQAGVAAFQERNYDKAIQLFTKAIASGELSQEQLSAAYSLRGFALEMKGAYDKAIADWTKVIELNPKNAEAYYHRGLAWHGKGDYDKAIVDYTKAIELDPKLADAYYSRGLAWFGKGDYDKFKADSAKAKKLGHK
jgi:tetratricopeptide (TPR) repeat protein